MEVQQIRGRRKRGEPTLPIACFLDITFAFSFQLNGWGVSEISYRIFDMNDMQVLRGKKIPHVFTTCLMGTWGTDYRPIGDVIGVVH